MKSIGISLLFALLSGSVQAQSVLGTPVGQWTSFYSYNEVTDMVEDGTTFYVGTLSGFYTYNRNNGDIEAFNKISGMANPGVARLSHDITTGITVIGYQNSNIDLFKDNTFFNIPSLFLSQVSGNKDINDIVCKSGFAYIATGKGLIVVNLSRKEIRETVVFYDNNTEQRILGAAVSGNTIYVTTSNGVYRSALDNPSFIYYGNWDKIDNGIYTRIISQGDKLYLLNDTEIAVYEANTLRPFYTHTRSIANIYPLSGNRIGFSDYTSNSTIPDNAYMLDASGQPADSIPQRKIVKVIESAGQVYVGEYKTGLRRKNGQEYTTYVPNAITDYQAADVYAYNGDFAVAHGGHRDNLNPIYNTSIYTIFKDNMFYNLSWVSNNYNFIDFVRIIRDRKTGTYYSTAFRGGVSEMSAELSPREYRDVFEPRKGDPSGDIYTYGLALDSRDNLWVVNYGTDRLLKVKTPDGNWYSSSIIINPLTSGQPASLQGLVGDIVIDKSDNMWLVPFGTGGLIVYNVNGTVDNNSDDFYKVLQAGKGKGNLPSNNVQCVAVDKNDNVWIGTDIGIAVYSCGYDIKQNCDADIPVIQNDDFPGYLFQEISITALAVDGANRKWVGTNTGLWLVSEDGRQTIHQFTTDNSPLPSNNIRRINIDPMTGDVYIATDMGLVRYKGTATDGRESMEKPLEIYPNPVPSGFGGMIAINGLTENADVRIVDMNGQLVFRTTANGGQAVWDGRDYLGKRAQSGVYIVMVRSKDGVEKANGKIIFRE